MQCISTLPHKYGIFKMHILFFKGRLSPQFHDQTFFSTLKHLHESNSWLVNLFWIFFPFLFHLATLDVQRFRYNLPHIYIAAMHMVKTIEQGLHLDIHQTGHWFLADQEEMVIEFWLGISEPTVMFLWVASRGNLILEFADFFWQASWFLEVPICMQY